ncbi:hypothetical protein AAC387_Pa08g1885 [Persea americana]
MHEHPSRETSEVTQASDGPWLSIPEKIHLDLDTSFQNVRNEMESTEEVKPSFGARLSKLFFHVKTRESMSNEKCCDDSTALPHVSEEGLSCLGMGGIDGSCIYKGSLVLYVVHDSENYLSHARGLDYNLGYCAQVRRHSFIDLGRI